MQHIVDSLQRPVEEHAVDELDSHLPKPPKYITPSTIQSILEHPDDDAILKKLVDAADAPLEDFDPGVLTQELLNLGIYQKTDADGRPQHAGGNITEGTYAGTQAAITQLYARIERR